MVTLSQIAQQSGVSTSTASIVVNERVVPGVSISASTRQRVLETARELGYQPNRLARSLREKKTKILGLMLSNLQNPFFVDVLETTERLALEAGYQLMLDTSWMSVSRMNQSERESQIKLRGWPVDGVLVWSKSPLDLTGCFGSQATALPTVYLGLEHTDGCDGVSLGLYDGGRQVARHLVERGYRRIAYVIGASSADPAHYADEPRLRAYLDVCAAEGIEPLFMPVRERYGNLRDFLDTGLEIAAMPRQFRPEACLCYNDCTAIGVLQGLRRAGLRVPQDIALAGFDGILQGQCLDIPLTTVDTPVEEMCREALAIAVRHIDDRKIDDRKIDTRKEDALRQVTLPMTLRIGGTT